MSNSANSFTRYGNTGKITQNIIGVKIVFQYESNYFPIDSVLFTHKIGVRIFSMNLQYTVNINSYWLQSHHPI